MAALRGTLEGDRQRSNSDAVSHRLADHAIVARADTWETFATIGLLADGSGTLTVRRNGETIARAEWPAER